MFDIFGVSDQMNFSRVFLVYFLVSPLFAQMSWCLLSLLHHGDVRAMGLGKAPC